MTNRALKQSIEKPKRTEKIRTAYLKAKKVLLTEIPPLRFGGVLGTFSLGDDKRGMFSVDKNGPHFNFRPKVLIAAMVFVAAAEIWRSQGLPPVQRLVVPSQRDEIRRNIMECDAEASHGFPIDEVGVYGIGDAAQGQAMEMALKIKSPGEGNDYRYTNLLVCAEGKFQESRK